MSVREHGTHAKYVVDRCKCEPCRDANRRYELARRRAMARPDEAWVPYVPAQKARAHIAELAAAGVGLKTIAKLARVPHGSLTKLVYGDRARRMGPSKRIRPETERKILSVTVADVIAEGGAQKIPAGPTWKLLDELIARGWTRTELARRLGHTAPALQVSRVAVRASTAAQVQQLHAELIRLPAPPRRTRWGHTDPAPEPVDDGQPAPRPGFTDRSIFEEIPPPGDWVRNGRCRTAPTTLFFPVRGENTEQAVAVCQNCPVLADCRDYAVAHPQVQGVWGGTTGRVRRDLRKEAS